MAVGAVGAVGQYGLDMLLFLAYLSSLLPALGYMYFSDDSAAVEARKKAQTAGADLASAAEKAKGAATFVFLLA